MAANKFEMLNQAVYSCWRCGAFGKSQACFCGNCGAEIRKENYCRSSHLKRLLKIKKKLFIVALFGFITAFVFTCTFLYFTRPEYIGDGMFLDVPIDHQAYADCQRLIALDGCRIRSANRLEPSAKASVADINQAMLAVIRFNKSELHQELLLSAEELNDASFRKYLARVAEYFDRHGHLAQIEEARFKDLSRFNIWSMIDKVFLEKANAY